MPVYHKSAPNLLSYRVFIVEKWLCQKLKAAVCTTTHNVLLARLGKTLYSTGLHKKNKLIFLQQSACVSTFPRCVKRLYLGKSVDNDDSSSDLTSSATFGSKNVGASGTRWETGS